MSKQKFSKADCAEFVNMAKQIGATLDLDQRWQVMQAIGNPVTETQAIITPSFDPKKLYEFEVGFNGAKRNVVARDNTEAWAKFCDLVKRWPPPASGSVRLIGESTIAESPIGDLPPPGPTGGLVAGPIPADVTQEVLV